MCNRKVIAYGSRLECVCVGGVASWDGAGLSKPSFPQICAPDGSVSTGRRCLSNCLSSFDLLLLHLLKACEKGTEEQMLQICGRRLYLPAKERSLGWLGAFMLSNLIQPFIEHLLCAIHIGGTVYGGKEETAGMRETTAWPSKSLPWSEVVWKSNLFS